MIKSKIAYKFQQSTTGLKNRNFPGGISVLDFFSAFMLIFLDRLKELLWNQEPILSVKTQFVNVLPFCFILKFTNPQNALSFK